MRRPRARFGVFDARPKHAHTVRITCCSHTRSQHPPHPPKPQQNKANAGANHTGKFSRLRFQHDALGAGASFQELRARLPAQARSLYYKDLIGNVSSSDTLVTPGGTTVALSLRYPLMGGWKVDFVLGECEAGGEGGFGVAWRGARFFGICVRVWAWRCAAGS